MTTTDPSSAQEQPAISFQTDDWDMYRHLGGLLLFGIVLSAGAYLAHQSWREVAFVGGFFLVLTIGCYILVRREGGLGRRYVITAEGISSTRDGYPAKTFLWRDVARVEKLQITVRTHDGRRVSFTVPRTLERRTTES